MVEPEFQRARQPAQKERRRAHLLETVRGLLARGVSLRALSLNELARQAGMSKANVYTYFESREALLLALLWDEWSLWFQRLESEWTGLRSHAADLDTVVALLARTLARAPLLCELTAALPTVLEQNLSEETIHAFKCDCLAFFGELARFLERCSPALSAASYADLAHDAAHAIVGLYPSTHPVPAVARALADPRLGFFRRDFGVELERVLGALAADHARRSGASREQLRT